VEKANLALKGHNSHRPSEAIQRFPPSQAQPKAQAANKPKQISVANSLRNSVVLFPESKTDKVINCFSSSPESEPKIKEVKKPSQNKPVAQDSRRNNANGSMNLKIVEKPKALASIKNEPKKNVLTEKSVSRLSVRDHSTSVGKLELVRKPAINPTKKPLVNQIVGILEEKIESSKKDKKETEATSSRESPTKKLLLQLSSRMNKDQALQGSQKKDLSKTQAVGASAKKGDSTLKKWLEAQATQPPKTSQAKEGRELLKRESPIEGGKKAEVLSRNLFSTPSQVRSKQEMKGAVGDQELGSSGHPGQLDDSLQLHPALGWSGMGSKLHYDFEFETED
jgi:hypothetical protein